MGGHSLALVAKSFPAGFFVARDGMLGYYRRMIAHNAPFDSCRSPRNHILTLLLLHFFFAAAVAGSGDAPITFVHRERSLQPGEVVLLEATSSRALKQLRAKAFGREFPVFADSDGRNWTGLLGIDLETKPGKYSVVLTGVDRSGTSISVRDVLVVSAKKFPTRELNVDQKYVTPPADVMNRIKREREKVNAIFASVTPRRLWDGFFQVPVPGIVISEFGKRNIYNGQPRSPHTGVDFRGATGTPIRAPNTGRIVLAENLYYSGNTVILDHGLGLYSYFGHMSAFSVKAGDQVQTGNLIGKVGATGLVTGPHLHWTVRLAGSRVDPLSLIDILAKAKGTEGTSASK